MRISIHAPTKGATPIEDSDLSGNIISIHAPTKGATAFNSTKFTDAGNFNPRSHEGSDIIKQQPLLRISEFQSTLPRRERHEEVMTRVKRIRISIHAPTKGATRYYFVNDITEIFQSTLPRRERQLRHCQCYRN